MSLLSSSLALALACSAFLVYELSAFRKALVEDLSTEAGVLAYNLTAPLIFGDPRAADASLAALKAKPSIRSAVLIDSEGRVFAGHGKVDDDDIRTAFVADSGPGPQHLFEKDRLLLKAPVTSEGTRIGTLVLEVHLDELAQRTRRYLLLTALILAVSLVAALGVSARLQRSIIAPIARLTEVAHHVSRHRNFAVRAPHSDELELGLLTDTFNNMLGQIEQQNADLQSAVRVRDEFLSVASHELKTPLTPLQLQVQALQRQVRALEVEALLPRVATIDRQVHRISKLVDSLLDISRLTAGRLELEYEELDLTQLVQEMAERYRQDAERAGSSFIVAPNGPVVGRWDPLRLEQVLTNLISNALKYGAGAPIELSVQQRGEKAEFLIRDHGIGIKPEDLGRIFDRFERAVSGRHYGGFGLGLWIVRELLTAMGGSVRVNSTPTEGSQFIVELPLAPPPKATSGSSTDLERAPQ